MRTPVRKAQNKTLPRREQLANERLRAAPLRALFPDIEHLRIELVFADPQARTPRPSPQQHTLYAPASAYFRYACPCSDCDGDFDLTEAVSALVAKGVGRRRAVTLAGHLDCQGMRFRNHALLQASCPMQLDFRLVSEPSQAETQQPEASLQD